MGIKCLKCDQASLTQKEIKYVDERYSSWIHKFVHTIAPLMESYKKELAKE